jgi:hypothetical protein
MQLYCLHPWRCICYIYESHTSDHLNSLVIIMCEFFNFMIWIVLSVQHSLHHGQSQHTSIFYQSSGTQEFAYIHFLWWRSRVAYTHDGISWIFHSNLCPKLPNKLEYKFAELSLFCQVHFTHFLSPLWQIAKPTLLFGYFTWPVCQVHIAIWLFHLTRLPSPLCQIAKSRLLFGNFAKLAVHFFVACPNFCPKNSYHPWFLFFFTGCLRTFFFFPSM